MCMSHLMVNVAKGTGVDIYARVMFFVAKSKPPLKSFAFGRIIQRQKRTSLAQRPSLRLQAIR